MKNLIRITLTIITVSVSLLNAQQNAGLSFLKIDVDARAAAMAGAYTAMANDASAAYWNPAGLALAENTTINGMYNDLFAGITHSFLAVQFATGEHAMAFSFNYQNVPGIEIRENPTEQPAGNVDAFTMAAAFSYARSYDEWKIGGSLKYLFEKYYLNSAPGWAIDLGVLKKNFYGGLDFGLVAQNLGKMSKLDQQETKLPFLISSGLAYKIPSFFNDNLSISSDLQWIESEKFYTKFGLQYYLSENLVLRGGLRTANDGLVWSGGFGINYDSFHLDYAYVPLEFELGTSNRLSVGVKF